MGNKFKVGDRVRAPLHGELWSAGEVVRCDPLLPWPIKVKTADGHLGAFREGELELIAPQHTFKIGDRVVALSDEAYQGTIFSEKNGKFAIDWDNLSVHCWTPDELRHVAPQPKPIKPGSRVRILSGKAAGKIGRVKSLNFNNAHLLLDEHYQDGAGQLVLNVSANTNNLEPLDDAA